VNNENSRRYAVTNEQMAAFKVAAELEKRCRLSGTLHAGDLYIETPFGEVILTYVHDHGTLTVTVVAAPGFLRYESIFARVEELTRKLQPAAASTPKEAA
jgi:hypothetical protein